MLTAGAVLQVVLVAAQLKLATVGFSQVGLSDAQAAYFGEHFSLQLSAVDEKNVRVTTPKDMAAVLGIERQKQLLGCADDQSSCMAELAGALGADGLVTGQLAKVGKSFQVSVKILAADGSRTLFLHSSKLLATEEELLEELNTTAVRAVAKLRAELQPSPVTAVGAATAEPGVTGSPGSPSRNKLKLLPGLVGVAGLVLGSIASGFAVSRYSRLNNPANWYESKYDPGQARSDRDEGMQNAVLASVFLTAGVVIVAATLLWFLLT